MLALILARLGRSTTVFPDVHKQACADSSLLSYSNVHYLMHFRYFYFPYVLKFDIWLIYIKDCAHNINIIYFFPSVTGGRHLLSLFFEIEALESDKQPLNSDLILLGMDSFTKWVTLYFSPRIPSSKRLCILLSAYTKRFKSWMRGTCYLE